ncbi:MAG: STAS/SEC14 domain-containing protein [Nocardioidaceae bacterium]
MLRILGDMPEGVLGLEAIDDVEKEDYENVIVPAVNQAIAQHGKVRLVYVLGPKFDEYEGEAVWEDLKLGVRNPTSFERMAIVTDARWAGPAVKIFSILWPGQARAFPLSELESAKRWAAENGG